MTIKINRTLTKEEAFALTQQGLLEVDIEAEVIDFLNGLLRQKIKMAKHSLVEGKTVESLLS